MPTSPFSGSLAGIQNPSSVYSALKKRQKLKNQTGLTQVGAVKDAKTPAPMGGYPGGRPAEVSTSPSPASGLVRKKLTDAQRTRRTIRQNMGVADVRKVDAKQAAALKRKGFIGGKAQGYWGSDSKFHPRGR